MPLLSQLPGEIKRRKLTKALMRLGFIINKKGGDGSHNKAIWPATQKSVTIQSKLRKDVLYYLLKELEEISDISWDNIKNEL